MPVILGTWKAEICRIKAQDQPGKIVDGAPISKTTRTKWNGGVAQAVEHLLSNCEALSSNPRPTKNFLKSQQFLFPSGSF
jgi:hypothetical protein